MISNHLYQLVNRLRQASAKENPVSRVDFTIKFRKNHIYHPLMKAECSGIQTPVTSGWASGNSQTLLAQAAAVIVRPAREHLPGAVRRWLRHRSTSWSPAASFLAKTSLRRLEKALREPLTMTRWMPWLLLLHNFLLLLLLLLLLQHGFSRLHRQSMILEDLFLIFTPMSGQRPETSRLCDDSVAAEGNS